jgi:hypothetical protein
LLFALPQLTVTVFQNRYDTLQIDKNEKFWSFWSMIQGPCETFPKVGSSFGRWPLYDVQMAGALTLAPSRCGVRYRVMVVSTMALS